MMRQLGACMKGYTTTHHNTVKDVDVQTVQISLYNYHDLNDNLIMTQLCRCLHEGWTNDHDDAVKDVDDDDDPWFRG